MSQDRWLRLEELLRRPRRGRLRLSPDEAAELARLYRLAASDLAVARRTQPDTMTNRYLNDLVMRAHNRLYAPPRANLSGVLTFLGERFPALVRQHRRLIALATGLFCLGSLIGFVAVMWDPNLSEALVPAQFREHMAHPLDGELAPEGESAALSTRIFLNNIQVGILAFGLGLTFGVGTTYVLIFNGLILGALAAVYRQAGMDIPFWATILPHGVIELTAIFLSGAAGLILSGALVKPGNLPRRQALARAAPAALGLMLGTIPMYIVAGLIEGFITPRSIPYSQKLAFAAFTGLLLIPYLVRFRRRRPQPTAAPAS